MQILKITLGIPLRYYGPHTSQCGDHIEITQVLVSSSCSHRHYCECSPKRLNKPKIKHSNIIKPNSIHGTSQKTFENSAHFETFEAFYLPIRRSKVPILTSSHEYLRASKQPMKCRLPHGLSIGSTCTWARSNFLSYSRLREISRDLLLFRYKILLTSLLRWFFVVEE